jgi:hypothetical protein
LNATPVGTWYKMFPMKYTGPPNTGRALCPPCAALTPRLFMTRTFYAPPSDFTKSLFDM